jgi:hypothetical protein
MILGPDGRELRRPLGFIRAYGPVKREKFETSAVGSDRVYEAWSDPIDGLNSAPVKAIGVLPFCARRSLHAAASTVGLRPLKRL